MSALPALDLLDGDWYLDPYETYAWHRENAPVAWDEINQLWGIFRYDDIVEIETNEQGLHQFRPVHWLPAKPSR